MSNDSTNKPGEIRSRLSGSGVIPEWYSPSIAERPESDVERRIREAVEEEREACIAAIEMHCGGDLARFAIEEIRARGSK